MHKRLKKVALSVSLLLVVAWCVLGTGASLAWFTDTDEEVKNIFHFAEFDLEVSHRLEDGTWEKVEQGTKLFDDEALYEPGYVQVVYLRIENKGEVPFDWKTAVTVTDYTEPTNIFGQKFHLQDGCLDRGHLAVITGLFHHAFDRGIDLRRNRDVGLRFLQLFRLLA